MIAPNSHRDRSAFTLVEILVSSAILLVLAGLLLGMGGTISAFWHASEGKRSIQRELLAAIRTMEADLRHAALTSDPSTLRINSDGASPLPGKNSTLFFLTSEENRDGKTGTGLSAVGYFVAESPDKKGRWNLYRFHAHEKETREALTSKNLQSLYATASVADPSTTELLAENIVGLAITEEREQGLPFLLRISVTGIKGSPPPEAMPSETASWVARNGRKAVSLVRLPPSAEDPSP